MSINADVKIGNLFDNNQEKIKQTHKAPQGASLAEFDMIMNKTNK